MRTSFRSGGKEIGLDAFEPAGAGEVPAILLLHGAGGNTAFWADRLAPLATAAGMAVYAAHYFDRTGTARADMAALTDGVHVPQWLETIGDALEHIARQPRVDAERLALVGISLGAFLSLAVVTVPGTREVRAIVEISGGLVAPFDGAATARLPPTLILHGEVDTVVPVTYARALAARLTRLGVAHETHVLPGEGHWFSAAAQVRMLGAIANFLRARL